MKIPPRRTAPGQKKPPHPAPASRALLIGIGNPLRQDDSIGRVVARRIKDRRLPALTVFEHPGEGASLMELWKRAGTVVVVDCVSSGSAAGTIHRFDARRRPLPGRIFGVSTHGFGLLEAVEMARALNRLPERLIVYGIEGSAFGIGENLSAAVARAVPRAVRRILKELEETVAVAPRPSPSAGTRRNRP